MPKRSSSRPSPAAAAGPGTDRPAAIPMTPRGLYALHVALRQAAVRSRLLSPAEQAARFGVPTPRALVQDLAVVAGPLLQDPNARAVFGPGRTAAAGRQHAAAAGTGGDASRPCAPRAWATSISATLARRLAEASGLAGGGLTVDDDARRPAADRRRR